MTYPLHDKKIRLLHVIEILDRLQKHRITKYEIVFPNICNICKVLLIIGGQDNYKYQLKWIVTGNRTNYFLQKILKCMVQK